MTGWRVGWLVVPERLIRPIECLQQNLSISVPYLSQIAAVAAFEATEELEAIKAGYAKNRAILMEALPRLGLPPCRWMVRSTPIATSRNIPMIPWISRAAPA